MLSVTLLSMLMILLSILSLIRQLISGNNMNWLLNLSLIYEMLLDWARSGLLIVDVKIDGSVLEGKSSFKMQRLAFCSKLNWGSYISLNSFYDVSFS